MPHFTTLGHATLCYQTNHIILSMVSTQESWQYFQCSTSHHTLSCHPTLHYATPPNTAIYNTSQHHTTLWRVTPHHIMSRYATTRHATPHSITLPSLSVQHVTPRLVMSPYTTLRHATEHSNLLYFTLWRVTPHHIMSRYATTRHDATLHYTSLKFFTESVVIVVLRYSLVSVCCHLSTACPSYSPPRWLAMYWLCSCSPYWAWWVNVRAHPHPKWFKSKFNKISKFRLCWPWIKYITMWKYC